MERRAAVHFTPYFSVEQAQYFASQRDGLDFYEKGPGMVEKGDVTHRMAQILQDDFFGEVDAIARGDLTHAAKLRFTHAEIMIPFAAKMELPGAAQQLPRA